LLLLYAGFIVEVAILFATTEDESVRLWTGCSIVPLLLVPSVVAAIATRAKKSEKNGMNQK